MPRDWSTRPQDVSVAGLVCWKSITIQKVLLEKKRNFSNETYIDVNGSARRTASYCGDHRSDEAASAGDKLRGEWCSLGVLVVEDEPRKSMDG